MGDFKEDWNNRRAGLRPIGYLLRRDGAKHWLRFRSLPESKRYAETQDERQILLSRQNELAKEVLGEEPCWLVQTQWVTPSGITDVADSHDPFRASREYGLQPTFQFMDEDTQWNVHALLTRWADEKFDELLWEIAEDRGAPTLWMSPATGAIFAPYDGGVDLFLSSQSMVASLAKVHPDWLSSHPSGR